MDIRVAKILQYLHDHKASRVSIRTLAENVELRESRLQHLFKEEVGLSIRHFILLQRLWSAAVMICTTDERISQICYVVGFTDVPNFNHAFSRQFGVCPTTLRRTAREASRGSHSTVAFHFDRAFIRYPLLWILQNLAEVNALGSDVFCPSCNQSQGYDISHGIQHHHDLERDASVAAQADRPVRFDGSNAR